MIKEELPLRTDGDGKLAERDLPDIGASVRRTTLVGQVADRLRELILSGQLGPGLRLRQEQLARQLGVSRTPLRDALNLLEREGLVQLDTTGRATVVEITEKDARQLFALREVLEGLAARSASERCDDVDVQRLQRLADQAIIEADAASEDDRRVLSQYAHTNCEFHTQLIVASGNDWLVNLIPVIRISSLMVWGVALMSVEQVRRAARAHLQIVHAIATGDGDRAEYVARAHLRADWEELSDWNDDGAAGVLVPVSQAAGDRSHLKRGAA